MKRYLALALLASAWCCGQSYTITTFAGSSNPLNGGFSGDGGPATNAQLYNPIGLAADSSGNLYIADSANHRVRKVTPGGIITTIAGSGGSGVDSGDGGPAINAQLSGPSGIAMDASGNLYIVCSNTIRKVSPSGIISTFAGNGTVGFSGDGGPAAGAQLNLPGAVAVDTSGNVYIADTWNGAIRKVSGAGVISTIAGQGGKRGGDSGDGGPAIAAMLGNPNALVFDAAGNLYIGDAGVDVVRKVDTNGIITTVAGGALYQFSGDGGPAINAGFESIGGVAVNAAGNLFIADLNDNRIREVLADGTIITVAGNGVYIYQGDGGLATNAGIQSPQGLLAVGNNIYISDSGHNLVRLLTPGAPAAGPPPAISKGGVVTLFTGSSTIEAFSWVSIYGTNLISGSTPVTWNGDYPLSLGGTTVTVNNKPAFLSYVSPTQVNILTPGDGSAGTVNVALTNANGTATSTATLASLSPAFSLLGDGKHAAAIILRSDGSGAFAGGTYDVVGPAGTSLGYKTVPAKAGDNVVFYGVGFGPTKTLVSIPFSGPTDAIFAIHLTVNGQPLTTTYAGMSAPGLFQFNVTIPPGFGTGEQPLLGTVNGISTQANVVITLK